MNEPKIGSYCVIAEGVELGENVVIKDFVRLAADTKIGNNTVIDSYVRSSGQNRIGSNCTIRYGSLIAREVTVEDNVFMGQNVATVYVTARREHLGGTVIGKGSYLSDNVVIGANCHIGKKNIIGAAAFLNHTDTSKNCFVGSHSVLGSQGQWVKRRKDGTLKRMKARGRVILADNVKVGSMASIHRGTEGDTTIDEGSNIGHRCNIGHDSHIGKHCIIVATAFIGGFAEIGDYARVSPAKVMQRVKIGHHAYVGIDSLVRHDVPPNTIVCGSPAMPINEFRGMRKAMKTLAGM